MLSWMVPDQPNAAFKLSIWAKALPAGNEISQMAIAPRFLSMLYLLQILLSSPLAYYDRALSWTLAEVLCYSGRQWFTLVYPYINTPTVQQMAVVGRNYTPRIFPLPQARPT